jgi:hypothetical protein
LKYVAVYIDLDNAKHHKERRNERDHFRLDLHRLNLRKFPQMGSAERPTFD